MDGESETRSATTWQADHSLIDVLMPPVPMYSSCLLSNGTLNLWWCRKQHRPNYQQLGRTFRGFIKWLECGPHLAEKMEQNWSIKASPCLQRYSPCMPGCLNCMRIEHTRFDSWLWVVPWIYEPYLTQYIATGDEDNNVLSIEGFLNLEALCFKVDLVSKAI